MAPRRRYKKECPVCGKHFAACYDYARFCSRRCKDKYRNAEEKKERAAHHKTESRMCEYCGNPFKWDISQSHQRFCSPACRNKAAILKRSNNRCRIDTTDINKSASLTLPDSLSALRKSKDSRYFILLFSLPPEQQYAEMNEWTAEDHAKALDYLGIAINQTESDIDSFGTEQDIKCLLSGIASNALNEEMEL